MTTHLSRIGESFRAAAEAAVDLASDARALIQAAGDLERSKRLQAVARDSCESCPGVPPRQVARSVADLEAKAAEASQRAHRELKRLSVKYRFDSPSLWQLLPGSSPRDGQKIRAESKPRDPDRDQRELNAYETGGVFKKTAEAASSIVESQGERFLAWGFEWGETVADQAAEVAAKAGKKVARFIDERTPASVKAATCFIPTPWTMGACLAFGVAGLTTAVDDFEKEPSLKNAGRILINGFAVLTRATRLADSLGQMGYGAATASSPPNSSWVPPSEHGLTPEDESIFEELVQDSDSDYEAYPDRWSMIEDELEAEGARSEASIPESRFGEPLLSGEVSNDAVDYASGEGYFTEDPSLAADSEPSDFHPVYAPTDLERLDLQRQDLRSALQRARSFLLEFDFANREPPQVLDWDLWSESTDPSEE